MTGAAWVTSSFGNSWGTSVVGSAGSGGGGAGAAGVSGGSGGSGG